MRRVIRMIVGVLILVWVRLTWARIHRHHLYLQWILRSVGANETRAGKWKHDIERGKNTKLKNENGSSSKKIVIQGLPGRIWCAGFRSLATNTTCKMFRNCKPNGMLSTEYVVFKNCEAARPKNSTTCWLRIFVAWKRFHKYTPRVMSSREKQTSNVDKNIDAIYLDSWEKR